MTIPGVAVMTAIGLVALIGDVGSFARPNKLVSYLGLHPRVRQSGGRLAWVGHNSGAGQGYVRGLLTEGRPRHGPNPRSAARIPRPDPCPPGTIAAIPVARKLTVLGWHLLHDKTD
jgi:transposase